MSYQLIILDLAAPVEFGALMEALEADAGAAPDQPRQPPSEKLAAFFRDVGEMFPSLEQDPERSPWSMTPTGNAGLDGRALSFSIGKSDLLFDVLMEFEELAWRHDVTICDPQEGTLRHPRSE